MTGSETRIQKILKPYPDARFSIPTPIQFLTRVSDMMGYNIYFKREDLTGFALGGNKVRKLDFLIADAVQKGADTLITKSASAFSRNAAAACSACNLKLHVCINGRSENHNSLSQDVFQEFGTTLHYTMDADMDENHFDRFYHHQKNGLKNRGRKVVELHPGGSDKIGSLGYVKVFDEIVNYSKKTAIHFDYIIHSTGSAGTFAGLLIGQNITGYPTRMIGMAASQDAQRKTSRILELAQECSHMLGVHLDHSAMTVDDQFIGPEYAVQSDRGDAAVRLFATLEGIFLDQVYTGKAAAGLIHYAKHHCFKKNDNILFIHTGGNAGLFY